MKQISIISGLNLGLLSLFSFLQPVQSITLELLPQTQNVAVGDSVIVDVQISELGDMESPSVGGFDFDLNYDPNVLTFDSLTFSNLINLSNFDIPNKVDPSTPGIVSFFNLSILDTPEDLNTEQPSSFSLATLDFTANQVTPNSLLSLTIISLSDENFDPLDSVIPEDAIVSVESAKTSVPESDFNLITWIIFLGLTSIYCKKVST
ncbi:cohesin domain-containing protein [Crocosphaera chwakensis]|uniref:Cohesin domain-containing protein n=1 Tax=Crocosphaera chwakensis CCY0110 TaxID=391612 RepID=A3IT76_9CHRO|nr:cohesin domain-containing protein [Crocosphaera chwakensis]EAZ90380.1 hypothetical protein CY0110_04918 [Crocosphaera chwakensis CCY0110]